MSDRIDYLEVMELAAVMCGMELTDDNESEVENTLCEKFQLDFGMLHGLMEKICPLIQAYTSPLSQEPLIGLADNHVWIWKRKQTDFINSLLEWMGATELKNGKNKGVERTITLKGKPEFKIILTHSDVKVTLKKQEKETKYLLWTGQYVGNSLLFWREGKAGYTTDIDKAHRFDWEEALKIHEGSDRTEKIIPLTHLEEIATPQVHADHLDRQLIGKEVTNG